MMRLSMLMLFALVCLLLPLVILRGLWAVHTNPGKAWGILLAFDRLGNIAANGDGLETISRRANRARAEGRVWGCVLCKLLDHIQQDHCKDAVT